MKKVSHVNPEKQHFVASEDYDSGRLGETDFGKVYYNMPHHVEEPKSVKELAQILKKHNAEKTKVTVRNTGHSVNGQTLTSGVQVLLKGITHKKFDKKKMEVTVGAGISWDELLQTVDFPKYCPPLYPNNPGQKIHATGNASVGGLGYSSAIVGGLWYNVSRLTLVTMTGKVIECSRTKNKDYFRYALSGFGRIGIIADMTVKVEKSKSHILGLGLVYFNLEKLQEEIGVAIEDPLISAVGTVSFCPNSFLQKLPGEAGILGLMIDVNPDEDIQPLLTHIRRTYKHAFSVGIKMQNDPRRVPLVSFKPKVVPKRNFVYCYPETLTDSHLDLPHIWTDPVVPENKYAEMVRGCNKIIAKYKMGKYLRKDTSLDEWDHVPSYVAYLTKKMPLEKVDFFPLSLSMKEAKHFSIGIAIELSVPSNKIAEASEMVTEINEFVYGIGGKNYLFSHHNLTKKQILQHYGKDTIKEWNAIKKKLDPNWLLNIGAIEHIDYM